MRWSRVWYSAFYHNFWQSSRLLSLPAAHVTYMCLLFINNMVTGYARGLTILLAGIQAEGDVGPARSFSRPYNKTYHNMAAIVTMRQNPVWAWILPRV
jgi:hypothetical protein